VVTFIAAAEAIHALTGFDLVPALGQTAAHARAFNASAGRPYAFWVGANLAEFFFGIGVCQALLFGGVLWVTVRRNVPIGTLCLALAAVLLVTDVIGISGEGASATFTRPMFQGKLTATVRASSSPVIVTMQIGAFRADAVRRGGTASISAVDVAIDTAGIRQQPEAPFQEAKQAVDLSQAERIVAVGRGIKSQDNLPLAQNLAKAMGAELAASRPICDSGWLPMERQVGSSGQTVAPRLYVALGISGAIQHLVGMKGSRTIVAINKDADAPIFEVADYGIVGDLFEIVPALTAELEKK